MLETVHYTCGFSIMNILHEHIHKVSYELSCQQRVDYCSFVFCLPSVAEPVQTVDSMSRKGPFSASENIRSITEVSHGLHCLNEVCSGCDVTSIYSLNSQKLPGLSPSQNGLGTRLGVTLKWIVSGR